MNNEEQPSPSSLIIKLNRPENEKENLGLNKNSPETAEIETNDRPRSPSRQQNFADLSNQESIDHAKTEMESMDDDNAELFSKPCRPQQGDEQHVACTGDGVNAVQMPDLSLAHDLAAYTGESMDTSSNAVSSASIENRIDSTENQGDLEVAAEACEIADFSCSPFVEQPERSDALVEHFETNAVPLDRGETAVNYDVRKIEAVLSDVAPSIIESTIDRENYVESPETSTQMYDSALKDFLDAAAATTASTVTSAVDRVSLSTDHEMGESSVSSARMYHQKINPSELIHQIKWISWHSAKTPIITQNENGPCPLLAVMNVLLLRGQVVLPDGVEFITAQNLLERLGDCILRLIPSEFVQRPDYQQNVSDALLVLPKLITGLDVNVKFNGVTEFEFTPELIVFDLLNICLYHGWIIDPSDSLNSEIISVVGSCSYNQLVERIIEYKHCGDSSKLSQAICAEEFLENSASQLTGFGLRKLRDQMKDNELAVFFRNNHFATILKHDKNLLLLVTDQGFLNEHEVIWETLNDVYGDSIFLNAEFLIVPPKFEVAPTQLPQSSTAIPGTANSCITASGESTSSNRQTDHDLMIAMSLMQEEGEPVGSVKVGDSEELDHQIALQLQEEENSLRTAASTKNNSKNAGSGDNEELSQIGNPPDSTKKKDKCSII